MPEMALARARAGEETAFRELTEPFRRELLVHCYRMLGSLQDAEDVLQETLVAAWRSLEDFEGRASLRTWLYRIATNRCLNALRDGARRPRAASPGLPFDPPPPTRSGEATWLEPCPDSLLESLPDTGSRPDARYETREAVGLAFVTALQRLPVRQRAALVLRDVLGFRAAEAAAMLDTTEATINSALQRARAAIDERAVARERAPAPGSPREREIAGTFADAFERGDIDRVVSLLTDDAWVTMPPEPYEYQGRPAIAAFLWHASRTARVGRETVLVPMRANGHAAFAHYMREPDEAVGRLSGVFVLVVEDDGIAMLTRFALTNVPPHFGLAPTLPPRAS